MSEAIQVSDDALKLMVAEHGVRGTARLLGMDDTMTETFRKRVTRAGWMQDPDVIAIRARSGTQVPTGRPQQPLVPALSPVAANAMELQRLSMLTRMGHGKAAATAAEHVATLDGAALLADANNVKALANHAATTFSWADQQPPSRMRIDVLLQKPEQVAAIDVESHVVEGEWTTEEQA